MWSLNSEPWASLPRQFWSGCTVAVEINAAPKLWLEKSAFKQHSPVSLMPKIKISILAFWVLLIPTRNHKLDLFGVPLVHTVLGIVPIRFYCRLFFPQGKQCCRRKKNTALLALTGKLKTLVILSWRYWRDLRRGTKSWASLWELCL